MKERLENALRFLKDKIGSFQPEIALIPGSGWDGFISCIENPLIVDYSEIPDFPRATFHKGVFVFGEIANCKIVSAGRLHYYEGIPIEETVMPVRLLRMLGVRKLLLTNASGGIDPAFTPGSFMVITDHIQWNVPSPLRGKNPDFLGPRFPDMSQVYSKRLQEGIFRAAQRIGLPLHKGVPSGCPPPPKPLPPSTAAWKQRGSPVSPIMLQVFHKHLSQSKISRKQHKKPFRK